MKNVDSSIDYCAAACDDCAYKHENAICRKIEITTL